MRQAGCEAQGDGFYSRSTYLRRLKSSVESRFRSLDRAQRNRARFSAPDFIAFHPGYACSALSSVEMADLMSHDRSVGVRGVSAMDQTRARCAPYACWLL